MVKALILKVSYHPNAEEWKFEIVVFSPPVYGHVAFSSNFEWHEHLKEIERSKIQI
jgi:hypothetical protein